MDMYLRMRGPRDKQVKNVEAAAYSLIKCPSRKALESLIHEEQILKAKEAPIRGLKDVLLECFRNNIGEQRKVENFIQSIGEPKKHIYMEELTKMARDSYINYLDETTCHTKYVTGKYFKPNHPPCAPLLSAPPPPPTPAPLPTPAPTIEATQKKTTTEKEEKENSPESTPGRPPPKSRKCVSNSQKCVSQVTQCKGSQVETTQMGSQLHKVDNDKFVKA